MGDRKTSARSLAYERRPDLARFAHRIRGALCGRQLERLGYRAGALLGRDRRSKHHRQQYADSIKGPHAHDRAALIERREVAFHRRVTPIARVVGTLAARNA